MNQQIDELSKRIGLLQHNTAASYLQADDLVEEGDIMMACDKILNVTGSKSKKPEGEAFQNVTNSLMGGFCQRTFKQKSPGSEDGKRLHTFGESKDEPDMARSKGTASHMYSSIEK